MHRPVGSASDVAPLWGVVRAGVVRGLAIISKAPARAVRTPSSFAAIVNESKPRAGGRERPPLILGGLHLKSSAIDGNQTSIPFDDKVVGAIARAHRVR
jgi:hypothetical protein